MQRASAAVVRAAQGYVDGQHAELRADYAAKLAELATWADRRKLAVEAKFSRAWLPPAKANRIMFACRPAPGDEELTPPDSKSAEWRERFQKLRTEQAAALFELAVQCAGNGHAAEAFSLLVEVIREQPSHERARQILGYEQYQGRWITPFEAAKAREGQVWHPHYGWLPAEHVARYEGGERYYNNSWMMADDEQRLRAGPRKAEDQKRSRAAPHKGWDIVTEHYSVHTTHSLEEGVQLATRLERLYDAWQQMFAAFTFTDAQLTRRFNLQAATRSPPQRHKVIYFRDRDEYVQTLQKDEPNIGVSTGLYVANKKTAYFYVTPDGDDTNLYHEATHQLFTETGKFLRDVGRDANIWIVEGIACFMESLAEADGWHMLGGNDAIRLRDAQHRLLVDDYYVPLTELTAYGMDQLKRDPNIAMLYSQASGLTYFLMFADDGRYRAPLVAYLSAIYQGRGRPGALAELCHSNNEELDSQYRDFMMRLK